MSGIPGRGFESQPSYESRDKLLRKLRPHQITLYQALAKEHSDGKAVQLFAPTASGKTLMVNSFAFEHYLIKGQRVLWVGHAWSVVTQALSCMFRRYGDVVPSDNIAHLASTKTADNRSITSFCLPLWRADEPVLCYTTYQTMYTLMKSSDHQDPRFRTLLSFKPDLIVIDESHIGAGGLFDAELRKLLNRPWKNACVVGMSATPRKRLGFNTVVGNFDLDDLVRQGVIAKPNHVAVRLTTPSKVRLDSNNKVNSYSEIAACSSRNAEIAKHFYENKAIYGKTIIFCANKQHANNLGKLLRGHNPLVIHGDVDDAHELLRRFASSKEHNLALLVRMGTTGLDIPELKTVMLAKPTTSDVEIVQMSGRAFRLAPGKRECFIVDFFENISDAGVAEKLYHFREAFGLPDTTDEMNDLEAKAVNARAGGSAIPLRASLTRHTFVNEPATVQLRYDADSIYQAALDGLHINPNQTFGIEFELTSDETAWNDLDEWERAAKALSAAIRKELGTARAYRDPKRYNVHGIKYDKWQVVFDGSCGWEIVSPILRGQDGFEEVVRVLHAVNTDPAVKRFKLKVDSTTGCHVHFGYNYRQAKKFQNLVQFVRRFEGALFTLCSASRFGDGITQNEYCMPLLGAVSDEEVSELSNADCIRNMFCAHDMRYHTVNLSLFDSNPQRLEVRMHSGTTDPQKILLWVALWQNIFNCLSNFPLDVTGFKSDAVSPEIKGSPDGDIVHVALKYLGLSHENHKKMLTKIYERRREVMSTAGWKDVLGTRKRNQTLRAWQSRFEEMSVSP